MALFYILAALFVFIGLYNLMIAILGLFPNCRTSTVGFLTKAKTYKNVVIARILYPVYTEYEYKYKVNGKEYKYSSFNSNHKKTVMRKTTMVYVKCFPKHAYPDKFTGSKEWLFGIMWLSFGLIIIFAILYY